MAKNNRCQRPKRAFLISTINILSETIYLKCVNALNGLFLFLHCKMILQRKIILMCQRPKRAFLISTSADRALYYIETLCQRPKRAFLISTFGRIDMRAKTEERCQRPKRAFLISTRSI